MLQQDDGNILERIKSEERIEFPIQFQNNAKHHEKCNIVLILNLVHFEFYMQHFK